MAQVWDAIVIGADPNGLVCAAYLARAGRKVLVLERRTDLGGAAATIEFAPGFRADVAAAGPVALEAAIASDLAPALRGVRILRPDPAVLALIEPGESLALWRDPRHAAQEISRFSNRDAGRWPAFCDEIHRFSEFLRFLYAAPAPELPIRTLREAWPLLPTGLRWLGLGAKARVELLRVLPMSIEEYLDGWFESPGLQGVLAAQAIAGMSVGPMAAGTAFHFLHRLAGEPAGAAAPHSLIAGGAISLWNALAAAIQSAGGQVRPSSQVVQVILKDGKAAGVALADGAEVSAKQVFSSGDSGQVFLDWVDAGHLDPGFLRQVRALRRTGNVARAFFALGGAARLRGDREGVLSGGLLTWAPSIEALERAADDAKYRRVSPQPWFAATLPSHVDPTRAPQGMHVLEVSLQSAPYTLADGAWDKARTDAMADGARTSLGRFIEGLDSVEAKAVVTPAGFAQDFGLAGGHPDSGEMTLDQILFQRPVPGWSNARTPIPNLYLCGAAIHPGGGVHGRPGRLAARRALQDGPR